MVLKSGASSVTQDLWWVQLAGELARIMKVKPLGSSLSLKWISASHQQFTHELFSFAGEEERQKKNSDYGLLPVTTGFTMATVSRGLCVRRSEAGDPAELRFSVTHNINHFIEVGQTVLEIHLKFAGTAQAGGRHRAWERITERPHTAGSCRRWMFPWTETSTVMFSCQQVNWGLLSAFTTTIGTKL